MEAKAAVQQRPVLQPCTQIALEIGQAMSAIQSFERMPNWPGKASALLALEQHLGQLEGEYERDCLKKK